MTLGAEIGAILLGKLQVSALKNDEFIKLSRLMPLCSEKNLLKVFI